MVQIRPETPTDLAAIYAVNERAFGQPDEADLVDALRRDGDAILSLVAEEEGEVVGHVMLSALPIESETASLNSAALAPVAVLPECQNRGIGSRLIDAAIAACRAQGIDMLVVLGHPEYYRRFGFSPDIAAALDAPFSGEAFMAMVIHRGLPSGQRGRVRYANAFGLETSKDH